MAKKREETNGTFINKIKIDQNILLHIIAHNLYGNKELLKMFFNNTNRFSRRAKSLF